VKKSAVKGANAMWNVRNGRSQVTVIGRGKGPSSTTKGSRRDGEAVLSPNLSSYLNDLRGDVVVTLVPGDEPALEKLA
jgi:hypothetical protein